MIQGDLIIQLGENVETKKCFLESVLKLKYNKNKRVIVFDFNNSYKTIVDECCDDLTLKSFITDKNKTGVIRYNVFDENTISNFIDFIENVNDCLLIIGDFRGLLSEFPQSLYRLLMCNIGRGIDIIMDTDIKTFCLPKVLNNCNAVVLHEGIKTISKYKSRLDVFFDKIKEGISKVDKINYCFYDMDSDELFFKTIH